MDTINLTIPGKPEYASVVRLMLSGVLLNFDPPVEILEDLKVCVSEFINPLMGKEKIELKIFCEDDCVRVFVKDLKEEDITKGDEFSLKLILLNALMDKVRFTEEGAELKKSLRGEGLD